MQDQFNTVQSQLESRRKKADKVYAALVKRGEKVEKQALSAIDDIDLSRLEFTSITDRKELEARLGKVRSAFQTCAIQYALIRPPRSSDLVLSAHRLGMRGPLWPLFFVPASAVLSVMLNVGCITRHGGTSMNDEKNKMTDKAGEIAKNIWLAGVGAYGRAVDEAHGRLEKAGVESPKLFRDLVKAGAALEDEAREAMQAGQEARHSVEERITRVRDNFNLQRPVKGEDLLALHEKDRPPEQQGRRPERSSGGERHSEDTAQERGCGEEKAGHRRATGKARPTSTGGAAGAKKPAGGARRRS